MSDWFYPSDFPPEFNVYSPHYRAARAREALLHALDRIRLCDPSGGMNDAVRAIDALIDAKLTADRETVK